MRKSAKILLGLGAVILCAVIAVLIYMLMFFWKQRIGFATLVHLATLGAVIAALFVLLMIKAAKRSFYKWKNNGERICGGKKLLIDRLTDICSAIFIVASLCQALMLFSILTFDSVVFSKTVGVIFLISVPLFFVMNIANTGIKTRNTSGLKRVINILLCIGMGMLFIVSEFILWALLFSTATVPWTPDFIQTAYAVAVLFTALILSVAGVLAVAQKMKIMICKKVTDEKANTADAKSL